MEAKRHSSRSASDRCKRSGSCPPRSLTRTVPPTKSEMGPRARLPDQIFESYFKVGGRAVFHRGWRGRGSASVILDHEPKSTFHKHSSLVLPALLLSEDSCRSKAPEP